jgi:alkylation response protein AidB-like acyl-CoA dehydrogenase
VRDGDQWVINGQKIWTTTWWGKYMFLAARTDREAKPHAGISMFIVPMDTPASRSSRRPRCTTAASPTSSTTDVRIPRENIVGPVDGGWKVLTDALANERGLVGGGIVLKVAHGFDLLCRDVRETRRRALRDDPGARPHRALAAEIEVGRRLMIHCAELATAARRRRAGRDQQGVLRRADGALRRGGARDPRPARRLSQGRPARCATAASSSSCAIR